jgi:hypothetical protein
MPTANLNNDSTSLDTGNDSIVIVEYISGKVGGATLNVTGFTPTIIPAGHVVIQETATSDLKPMPVNGAAYDALPAGHTYSPYVTVASVLTAKPFVGLMDRGTVNPLASAYTISSILAAVKTAQPNIIYRAD